MRIPAGGGDDDPQLRHRHARLPLAALRRRRRRAPPTRSSATAACCCSSSTPPRRDPATNRGAGRRAADPGDRGPLAGGDRRHPAAPLEPGALPRPRPAAARRRSLGPGLGRLGQSRPLRRRPLHPLPARAVPGRRLRGPDRARVQLRLLGPRHRRLRPPGPGLDQPAQALPRRQRQGRHRQRLGPALPLQRRHDDGHGQRRRLLLLRTGHRARTAACSGPAARGRCAPTASSAPPRSPPAGAAPTAQLAAGQPAGRLHPATATAAGRARHATAQSAADSAIRRRRSRQPLRAARRRHRWRSCRRSCRRPRRRSCGRCRPAAPRRAPTRSRRSAKRRRRSRNRRPSPATSQRETQGFTVPPYLLGLVLLAALAGASVRGGPGARRRSRRVMTPAPAFSSAERTRRSRR